MEKRLRASLLFLCFLLPYLTGGPSMAIEEIPVGLILYLNSSLGIMAQRCIEMGLEDFYNQSSTSQYKTRLSLRIKNSEDDVVTAASAAWDLIKNEKVHAIIGPENLDQARFVVELGNKSQVPVIWFSPTGPSLSPNRNQIFNLTVQSLCLQFNAIAAIVEAYAWQAIIPIYEDTPYGKDPIPCLTNALTKMGVSVPYQSVIDPNSEEEEILGELDKLKGMQTQVFLVHMTTDLGSKFIRLAQRAEMIREGFAWLVTQGLSRLIHLRVLPVMGYMQGSLGVRPMVQNVNSTKILDFQARWKEKYSYIISPTLSGLWAYDTIQALAVAVEEAGIVSSTLHEPNINNKSIVEFAEIGTQGTGPKLLNTIQATKFAGLSGNLSFSGGQLESSVLEVYNVIGQRERIIGYWNPQRKLVQNISDPFDEPTGKDRLKQPMWPGDTTDKPQKLRIGVPVRKDFTELVRVERPSGNRRRPHVFGFAFQVFLKVVDVLPFPLPYEFVSLPKENGVTGNYDELLCQMKDLGVDVIIGDITILANRTKCVDFTMPYLESSVAMMVTMRPVSSKWILLEPFNWLLWLILGGIFVGATITVIILETNKNKKDKQKTEAQKKDDFNKMVRFPFSIYTRETEEFSSDLTKWMVIMSSFLFVIVVQVYTANLTSLLTDGPELKAAVNDVEEIRRNNWSVGYQNGSWVKQFLVEQIRLNQSQLKPLDTREQYADALSRGREKEGVDAIFDETPYLLLFLSDSKYGSRYGLAGTFYKTGGFGFAFPQKDNLVPYFSNAILNITQDVDAFNSLKNKFSLPTAIDAASGQNSASQKRSLNITDFGGLFPLVLYTLGLFFSLAILKSSSVINRLAQRMYFMSKRMYFMSRDLLVRCVKFGLGAVN